MSDPLDPNVVFTPGSPVSSLDFFRGRLTQIRRIQDSIPSPGRHPVVFGQRGVGKTSLANILPVLLHTSVVVKVTCVESDTFKAIWMRALERTVLTFTRPRVGFEQQAGEVRSSLAAFLARANGLHPPDVAVALENARGLSLVYVLDELDRITDVGTKRQTADLIKTLSDTLPDVTLVLVGVGQSIAELTGAHRSVERNLVQIEMPVMTDEEIADVVRRGCERLVLPVEPEVLAQVAELANGFPYYAHLLGLAVAKTTRQTGRAVDRAVFDRVVCGWAVEDAMESYRLAFAAATTTANPSRYPRVLCGCGYARVNLNGEFRTGDVVAAMNERFEDDVTAHSIKKALANFCEPQAGGEPVLVRRKVGNVQHYRFRDPMMRPFLRIKSRQLLSE